MSKEQTRLSKKMSHTKRSSGVRGSDQSLGQLFVQSSGRTLGPMLAAQSIWTLYLHEANSDSIYLAALGLIVGTGVGITSWKKAVFSEPTDRKPQTKNSDNKFSSKPR